MSYSTLEAFGKDEYDLNLHYLKLPSNYNVSENSYSYYQPGPYLLSCQMLLLPRISENNTPPNFRLAGWSNSFPKIITPPQFSIEVCQILETDKELSVDQKLRVIHL